MTGIGRLSTRVEQAMMKTLRRGISYVSSTMFDTDVSEDLARFLVNSTDGKMSKAVFYCSGKCKCCGDRLQLTMSQGSEANEAAYKLCLQYHAKEKTSPEPTRTLFIARDRSYHGSTLGALDLSGHQVRRELYESVLPRNTHHVSPCYSYRGVQTGETVAVYVARLKDELVQKIKDLGPKNVAAFICEPVVGAVSLSSLQETHIEPRESFTGHVRRVVRYIDCGQRLIDAIRR